jgi:hypothetical protein
LIFSFQKETNVSFPTKKHHRQQKKAKMMPTLANEIDSRSWRLASTGDLDRIEYCCSVGLKGTQGLGRLARVWLAYYLTLVRLGYARIEAPMGAICASQWRACGDTSSQRSAYRAHAELERHGFITRKTLRIGRSTVGSKISINVERFDFWLRGKTVVGASSTVSHVSPALPTCHSDKVSSSSPKLQTNDPEDFVFISSSDLKSKNRASLEDSSRGERGAGRYSKKIREQEGSGKRGAGSGEANEKKSRRKGAMNGILYSLGLVLQADRPADQSALMFLADKLLSSGNRTVFDRDFYTDKKWIAMGFDEREHVSREVFVPALRLALAEPETFGAGMIVGSLSRKLPRQKTPLEAERAKIAPDRHDSCYSERMIESAPPFPPSPSAPPPPPPPPPPPIPKIVPVDELQWEPIPDDVQLEIDRLLGRVSRPIICADQPTEQPTNKSDQMLLTPGELEILNEAENRALERKRILLTQGQ